MKILGITPRSPQPVSKAVAFVGDVVGSVGQALADQFNRTFGNHQDKKYSHIQNNNDQPFDTDGMGCKYCSANLQRGDTCDKCEERVNPQAKFIGYKKPVQDSGEPSIIPVYNMR